MVKYNDGNTSIYLPGYHPLTGADITNIDSSMKDLMFTYINFDDMTGLKEIGKAAFLNSKLTELD